jgi:hypothetical protein
MSAPHPSNCTTKWLSTPIATTLLIALLPTAHAAAQGAQPRAAGQLRITSPDPNANPDSVTTPDPTNQLDPTARPCVLLKNDNVLFGDAHQLGKYVIVRTGPLDELRLARSEVSCWAQSLTDLYRYRLDHRPKPDLQTHLHDARWCMQHELLDEAGKEIQAAKKISPNHHAVRLLEGQLQRRRQPPAPVAPIKTANFTQDTSSTEVGAANRVDPMVLSAFAGHVQPTLINRCGRCHNRNTNLQWRLTVPPVGTRPTAPTTRENLAASLRFIDRDEPQQSILLTKATSPHGGSDAPLGARNAKAIDALRRWLSMSAGSLSGSPLGRIEAESQVPEAESDSAIARVSFESDVATTSQPAVTTGNESDQPKRLPTVANPFDPSLFNRRFHR